MAERIEEGCSATCSETLVCHCHFGGCVNGIMLCDDLIFFSRVASAARAAGRAVKQARTPAEVLKLAATAPPGGVLVDLHNEALDLRALLAALRELRPVPRVVAFGSHVDAERLRAARAAGCDRVLPRSKFVEELETDLAEWFTPFSRDAERSAAAPPD